MSNLQILIIFLTVIVTVCAQDCSTFNACTSQLNCQDCVRAHHCCVWCYEKDFNGSRCLVNGSQEHQNCDPAFIENNEATHVSLIQNKYFTDVNGTNPDEAVQLKPQKISVSLRRGEPVNVSISYKPSKNYPLNLYYLMDLTKSMEADLNTLKHIGAELAISLKMITTNYKIAFGSYIDKPELPFYNTAPHYMDDPCLLDAYSCGKGYLFKHRLSFTENVEDFVQKVNESELSANFDNLEGGMDALMQIVLCGKKLGWMDLSRKLVIIATEGGMHLAGDGVLAGYVIRNRHQCLIDDDGNYTSSVRYDYPSLEEIYNEVKKKKTNIIVAAKSNNYEYYQKMAEVLNEVMYVGKLENGSANILKLVKEGYYSFISKVNLLTTKSEVTGLKVDFFADCDGNGNFQKKSHCDNAQEGKEMEFIAQFMLEEYPELNVSDYSKFTIEEDNIHDKIEVNLKIVGSNCKCQNLGEEERNKTCPNGTNVCGDCKCNAGWTGDECREECKNDLIECRFEDSDGIISSTCNSRGDCICSKCDCHLPYHKGKACQYECPHDKQSHAICSGHGVCTDEGICICSNQYINEDCSCYNSTLDCTIPGFKDICNNRGSCDCNQCECNLGYSGRYCENCYNCTGLCSNYQQNVVDGVINHKRQEKPIQVDIVEYLPEEERTCVHRYTTDDEQKCDIYYKYKIKAEGDTRMVVIKATKPSCSKPLAAGLVAGLIIGAFLLAAMLIIIVWKGRNMYRDKKEYEKFLESSKMMNSVDENPLYKSPVQKYEVPVEMRRLHSKTE